MAEHIVEHRDGTTERVTDSGPSTVIVERRGGSGAGLLFGLAFLIAVVIGALYLLNQNSREAARTDAITSAADSVSDAARDVGGAAKEAAKKVD